MQRVVDASLAGIGIVGSILDSARDVLDEVPANIIYAATSPRFSVAWVLAISPLPLFPTAYI